MAERSNAAVLKTVEAKVSGGSNPSLSATKPAPSAGFRFPVKNPDKIPDKKLLQMLPYKLAKVYNGANEWFVHYHYWSISKEKYVRVKVRLEQWKLPPSERQKQLNETCDEINAELRQRNRRSEYHDEKIQRGKSKHADITIVQALIQAAKNKEIAESRAKTYHGLATKLKEFYKKHPAFSKSFPQDVDDRFINTYRRYLKDEKYVGKTINKHLWALQALLAELGLTVDLKKYRVRQIKNETGKYPPLTHEEKEMAFAYFHIKHPGYYLMLLCQYYTCIRPAELHRLKVKNFDLERGTIFVPWLDSKNGLSAHVQLLDPLARALEAAGIKKLPIDWYLFGDKCNPGPIEYHGDYASKTWSINRKRMNMPDSKQAYGLKHTFNRDYVENNKGAIDWEFLRRHNRHATIQQTQDYISELTAYFLDQGKSVIMDYTSGK